MSLSIFWWLPLVLDSFSGSLATFEGSHDCGQQQMANCLMISSDKASYCLKKVLHGLTEPYMIGFEKAL